jgi:hypothetical protein
MREGSIVRPVAICTYSFTLSGSAVLADFSFGLSRLKPTKTPESAVADSQRLLNTTFCLLSLIFLFSGCTIKPDRLPTVQVDILQCVINSKKCS